MPAPQSRSWQPRRLDAGCFQPEISSFRLHLAAEGKAARTARTCTGAVQWFAAARLRPVAGRTGWEQVRRQDVQEWIVWLLERKRSLTRWPRDAPVRTKCPLPGGGRCARREQVEAARLDAARGS